MYQHLLKQVCDIQELDQSNGSRNTVITDLRCTYPFPYTSRQPVADTALEVQLLQVYTEIPTVEIKESMRIVFDEAQTGDYRIHSISKWPKVNPFFLEILLHGEGNG